jgi:hypothetical protein
MFFVSTLIGEVLHKIKTTESPVKVSQTGSELEAKLIRFLGEGEKSEPSDKKSSLTFSSEVRKSVQNHQDLL